MLLVDAVEIFLRLLDLSENQKCASPDLVSVVLGSRLLMSSASDIARSRGVYEPCILLYGIEQFYLGKFSGTPFINALYIQK